VKRSHALSLAVLACLALLGGGAVLLMQDDAQPPLAAQPGATPAPPPSRARHARTASDRAWERFTALD
jgi:hypothetical protein